MGCGQGGVIKTALFYQPDLFDPILTRHFLQYARRAHARISSSWHACMNEPASMTRHACCCCCCWLLCSSQQQLLAAAAAASSSQQQPAASSAQHPAWLLRGHAVASKPGCMLHGMSCCFKTGMHAAWHELLLQNRDACCMSCCFNSSSCCCVHACVRGCLRDRHHISADTSAQTQAWRIEFSHRNIRD